MSRIHDNGPQRVKGLLSDPITYSAPSEDTAKCNFVCLLHFPEYSAQLVPKVHIKMITNLH